MARTGTKWGWVYASVAAYGDTLIEVDLEAWEKCADQVPTRKLVAIQVQGANVKFFPFFPPKFGLIGTIFSIDRGAIIIRGKATKDAIRKATIAWDPKLATDEEKEKFKGPMPAPKILRALPGQVPGGM